MSLECPAWPAPRGDLTRWTGPHSPVRAVNNWPQAFATLPKPNTRGANRAAPGVRFSHQNIICNPVCFGRRRSVGRYRLRNFAQRAISAHFAERAKLPVVPLQDVFAPANWRQEPGFPPFASNDTAPPTADFSQRPRHGCGWLGCMWWASLAPHDDQTDDDDNDNGRTLIARAASRPSCLVLRATVAGSQ